MLPRDTLEKIGFSELGQNVQISDRGPIYGADRICLGSNVRIDDFFVLAYGEGGIYIGNYVHTAVGSSVMGAGKIKISDFSGRSSRLSIYSTTQEHH